MRRLLILVVLVVVLVLLYTAVKMDPLCGCTNPTLGTPTPHAVTQQPHPPFL